MAIIQPQPVPPTRRQWLVGLSLWLVGTTPLEAAEFWNRKDAADWSGEEVLQLTTRSPWAKTARLLPKQGRDRGGLNDMSPGSTGPGRAGERLGEVAIAPVTEVTVVWLSAQPLQDALKSRPPEDFAGHYAIGVTNLPAALGGRKVSRESMQASLQTRTGTIDSGPFFFQNGVTLFGFSRELLPISVSDKEAIFSLESNQFSIRTRFDLKEMTYRGKLAV